MNSNYDVIVVGAGPAGIFTCYELTLKLPEATILLIDKGHDIYRRNCPILQKKLKMSACSWQKRVCWLFACLFYHKWFRWSRRIFRWKV